MFKFASKRDIAALESQVSGLRDQIRSLEWRTRHPSPCSNKFGPLANAYSDCKDCGHSISAHECDWSSMLQKCGYVIGGRS